MTTKSNNGNDNNSVRSTRSSGSYSSADESGSAHRRKKKHSKHGDGKLPPPILVYHESARSIVFRDHLRRAASRSSSSLSDTQKSRHNKGVEEVAAIDQQGEKKNGNDNGNKKQQQEKQPDNEAPRRGSDALIEVTSELTHMVGLDRGETVMPSQAKIPSDQIANFQPRIQPLPALALGPDDEFHHLLQQTPVGDEKDNNKNMEEEDWSPAEREVVQLLRDQKACVKTIRNGDWTSFLKRFQTAQPHNGKWATDHSDIGPHKQEDDDDNNNNNNDDEFPFNSFVTSTSLLPNGGKKMRCFGSISQFTIGVVFALPSAHRNPKDGTEETEDEASTRTRTWSWPAGYSAKTEFNIDGRGNLINGRQEALTPLSVLRQYNTEYLTCEEYTVAGRKVKGLSQIPYNEIFLRVGGRGRIVHGHDCATGKVQDDAAGTGRSLDKGVGLPIALFVRSASFGQLISLLRTQARLVHVLGEEHCKHIPLLLITPEDGTRVLTEALQLELWKVASNNLNPFQNPAIARKTQIDSNDEASFQQKVDELLDLDGSIRQKLTPEELAHLAGGFGATDESVAEILKSVMLQDIRVDRKRKGGEGGGGGNDDADDKGEEEEEESHQLQDFVNEGLTAAVRSGDYLTARQLLILYSVVATRKKELDAADEDSLSDYSSQAEFKTSERSVERRHETGFGKDAEQLVQDLDLVKKHAQPPEGPIATAAAATIPPPPPPPPLDTDRLRGATNSDGLLAVLGAAQILKAMQDGGAKKRTMEAVDAVEEWVKHGEQSMAFRISSWYDQRAAQGDLQIATENDSNFMAFVSNKAIANRRNFAGQLKQAASSTDFTDVRFLRALEEMVNNMHAPCLRLELLQYVLGLDNRFSVSHVGRAVHLAATCLGVSGGAVQ